MEKRRLFDDSRVEGIISSIDWNKLSRDVYKWNHSIRIDDRNSIEFFMYDSILEIEIWHWVGGWVTCSRREIRNDGYFMYNLEGAIRNCLIEAKI